MSGAGKMIHPNAVRYFLYNAEEELIKALNTEERSVSEQKEYWENFDSRLFQNDDKKRASTDAQSYINANIRPNSRTIKGLAHTMLRKHEDQDARNMLLESFRDMENSIQEFITSNTRMIIYREALEYVRKLSDAFEVFYNTFAGDVHKINHGIESIGKKYEIDSDQPVRYVCATKECLDALNRKSVNTTGTFELPGDLCASIFEKVRSYAVLKEKGEITIAMEGTWAPWTFHDEEDVLTGYDTEVGKLIAEGLGVEPVFVEGEWDGLFAGLNSSRYDIVANGVEVTPERAETYDFSEPYAFIRTAIIVRDDNTNITSFEDLDGKHTANTLASTYATLAESYGATATGVDDLAQTIELLLAGRVDATLNAEVTYYDYMAQHPDAPIKIAALTDTASEVSIPVRKGENSAALLESINAAIDSLRESGELSRISEKYFGSDISSIN